MSNDGERSVLSPSFDMSAPKDKSFCKTSSTLVYGTFYDLFIEFYVYHYTPHTHTHTTAGKNTWQYRTVKKNLESITNALKSNSACIQSLSLKVKAKGWLPVSSKPSEEELVSPIIDRIKNNTTQFGEFIAMLEDIKELDLVVSKLKSED